MTKSTAEITKAIRTCYFKFDHVLSAMTKMQALVEATFSFDEPDILVFTGEPGVGKSALLKRFARNHPRVEHDEFTEIPVLYVPIPSKCSRSGLPSAMLQALGSPFWNRGTERELTHQLLTLLRACKVKAILLDEVNHLIDRGAERTHYDRADWLKQLSDATRIPIVMAGIPRLNVLFRTNEQLADRVSERIVIEPFRAGGEAVNKMKTALETFDRLLDHLPRIPLADDHNCEKFAFATAGRLRGIRRLLVRAVEISQSNARSRIDQAVLAQAFTEVIYPGARPDRNPFHQKFDQRPLTGANEPFEPRRPQKVEADA
jgi:hypothetical protein